MARAVPEKRAAVNQGYFEARHPGVYREDKFGSARRFEFSTGVPAFLGFTPPDPAATERAKPYNPVMLSLWSQFEQHIGRPQRENFLAYAVRGFFENGGERCCVVLLEDNSVVSL